MFAQAQEDGARRRSPRGMVSAASTAVGPQVWHYILSIDVTTPWRLSGDDLYPKMPGGSGGWVAHQWFTGHAPTPCVDGSRALASGCVSASVRSARDIPAIHNTRPVMVRNDTRVFDLLELAPVVYGWVLLGEVDRYVPVSNDRFDDITFSAAGIRATVSGSAGETTTVTALEPAKGEDEWVVRVKRATFGETGKVAITFQQSVEEVRAHSFMQDIVPLSKEKPAEVVCRAQQEGMPSWPRIVKSANIVDSVVDGKPSSLQESLDCTATTPRPSQYPTFSFTVNHLPDASFFCLPIVFLSRLNLAGRRG
eukprot:gene17842-biopygen411